MDRLVALGALRLREQARDLALRVEDALALHFGRMRGEHGRDVRAREPLHQRLTADVAHFIEGVRKAARPARRAGLRVRAPAAVLVLVLGDIQEMREEAEGAHHVHRLVEIERVQELVELRRAGVFAPEGDGGLADPLDAIECFLTRLRANHLAEQPP